MKKGKRRGHLSFSMVDGRLGVSIRRMHFLSFRTKNECIFILLGQKTHQHST